MFEYYIVVNKPVPVYDQPSSVGNIINAYDIGTRVGIIKIDSGWMYTDTGTYIFQSSNIIPFKKYKIDHANDMIMAEAIDPNIPDEIKQGPMALSDIITISDTVSIKEKGVKDAITGEPIPDSWVGKVVAVTKIEGRNITVRDTTSDKSYTVPATCLDIYEGDGKFKKPLAFSIPQWIDDVLKITDTIGEYVSRGVGGVDYESYGITDLRQVYGFPYQFLPWVDNRKNNVTNNNEIGRKFGQKIVSRAPVLIMQAGVADFMRGFSSSDESFMMKALGSAGSIVDKDLEQMANTPGRFYGLKLMPEQYFNAVNQMAHAMASLLGISGENWSLPNGKGGDLGSINWSDASENPNIGFYSGTGAFYGGSVAFYINSEPQISESMSNATTRSMLDQKMNELGRMASEIQFLLGGVSGATNIETPTQIRENLEKSDQSVGKSGTIGGVLDSIIENVQVLMIGGRMAFPEIWADSQFSRSYSVTIKLDSPDCDNMSIFANILLPLAHILGFVLPRSVGSNNYISPFLVRAYYKSMFHIDMGIITGCNITKGDVGAWTQNGLPTQVTVQLEIKDLYNVISLATGVGGGAITSNLGQMDYIANMCGINIDGPDIERTLRLWWAVHKGALGSYISGIWDSLIIRTYNRWNDFWTGRNRG